MNRMANASPRIALLAFVRGLRVLKFNSHSLVLLVSHFEQTQARAQEFRSSGDWNELRKQPITETDIKSVQDSADAISELLDTFSCSYTKKHHDRFVRHVTAGGCKITRFLRRRWHARYLDLRLTEVL